MRTVRSRRRAYLELPPVSVPSLATGALAIGSLALGALAIGALAIGRLRSLRADADRLHLGTVEIDDLTVKRLHVIDKGETERGDPDLTQSTEAVRGAVLHRTQICCPIRRQLVIGT